MGLYILGRPKEEVTKLEGGGLAGGQLEERELPIALNLENKCSEHPKKLIWSKCSIAPTYPSKHGRNTLYSMEWG